MDGAIRRIETVEGKPDLPQSRRRCLIYLIL